MRVVSGLTNHRSRGLSALLTDDHKGQAGAPGSSYTGLQVIIAIEGIISQHSSKQEIHGGIHRGTPFFEKSIVPEKIAPAFKVASGLHYSSHTTKGR